MTTNNGLDSVVVAETAISDVDGERGRLIIAGADVEQLAPCGFEAAAARVLAAAVPAVERAARELATAPIADADTLRARFRHARARAWELLPRLGDALSTTDAMAALRSAAGHLPATGDDATDALSAIGALPVFAAAWSRTRAGAPLVPPSPELDHAADYLAMSLGAPPPASAVAALDSYLATVIDHGMNASTFTARVVASTGSDLVSAIVAAIGALKGPLHGGAPGPVLDMLDAVAAAGDAEAWLVAELAAGRRIMGMGHRIYRVRDPRAAVLEAAVKPLASPRLEHARAVERAAAKILRERKPD